jgi:acetone carboxylase gamma subunit
MKLVVQCSNGASFVDYLRLEFLAYKLLNKVTPLSYRVRWVDIAYNELGKSKTEVRPGFFVETKKNLAKRNNLKTADEVQEVFHDQLDASQAALLEHFQFLIGNTDYSLVQSADSGECCHNAKLLRIEDADAPTPYVPIIYDFDSTGLVNAKYTAPATSLGIKRVTQRVFRGVCRGSDVLEAARSNLLQQQTELLDLINTDPLLRSSKKKSTDRYLTLGFDILASENKYKRYVVTKCL